MVLTAAKRNDDEIRSYFDHWHVYHVIVDNNYMFHQQLHQSLRQSIAACHQQPFSILDLGCGAGSEIANTLAGLPAREYTGVDLSEVALAEARKNLSPRVANLHLVQSELGAFLNNQTDQQVDILLAGFALHHYTDDQKPQFFQRAASQLSPGGSLYIYDVFRRPGESRSQYLDDYCNMIMSDWHALSDDEKKSTCTHVEQNDYPVEFKVLKSHAEQYGLSISNEPLYADPQDFHCLYHFIKN